MAFIIKAMTGVMDSLSFVKGSSINTAVYRIQAEPIEIRAIKRPLVRLLDL